MCSAQLTIRSNRPYLLLWLSEFVDLAGDELLPITAIAIVLKNGQANHTLGILLASQFIGIGLAIAVGGSLSDRFNPVRVLLAVDCYKFAVLFGLLSMLLVHLPKLDIWLPISIFLASLGAGVGQPTNVVALMKTILPHQIQQGNAGVSLLKNSSRFVGPTLAGVIIVLATPAFAVGVDLATVIVSAICVFSIVSRFDHLSSNASRTTVPNQKRKNQLTVGFRDGFRQITRIRWLLVVECLGIFQVLFAVGPWFIALPLLAKSHGGILIYGAMLTCFSGGGIFGALLGMKTFNAKPGLITLFGTCMFGLSCVALATYPNNLVVAISMFIAGLGMELADIVKMTYIQKAVGGALLGRVIAIDLLATFVFLPLSQSLSGIALYVISPTSLAILGAFVVLISSPLILAFRGTLNFDSPLPRLSPNG